MSRLFYVKTLDWDASPIQIKAISAEKAAIKFMLKRINRESREDASYTVEVCAGYSDTWHKFRVKRTCKIVYSASIA